MKPKVLFLTHLEKSIHPVMSAVGFKFLKSKLRYVRKSDIIEDVVQFQLNRYNSEDNCEFWSHWNANSLIYSQWHIANYGLEAGDNSLGILLGAEWNIPGWQYSFGSRATLQSTANDEIVLSELVDNIKQHGIPYLQSLRSWKTAAGYQSILCRLHKAIDFAILDNDFILAQEIARRLLREIGTKSDFDSNRLRHEIQRRVEKHSLW